MASSLTKLDSTIAQIDQFNDAFGEKSSQPNHEHYASQLSLGGQNLLDSQNDIFEQEPDEYFASHSIEPIMQNKLKLEMNQQIQGISLWRDKKS